ncbi:hypothetical protein ACP70R_004794 [Stipagrostis hirtigluma subsp. patula]
MVSQITVDTGVQEKAGCHAVHVGPHATSGESLGCSHHVVVNVEVQVINDDGGDAGTHRRNAAEIHVPEAAAEAKQDAGRKDHLCADEIHVPEAATEARDVGGNKGRLCAVCVKPTEWVAVGRCGHRAVCRRCMVRSRFFYGSRRCCICRTRCPKVIVTRSDAGDVLPALLKLPLFTLREGRAGRYWYSKHTAAYFEDEKEYQATKADCEGALSPFFSPFDAFVAFYLFFLFPGMGFGRCFATNTDPMSTKWRDSAVGGSIGILVATIVWSILKRFPNTTEYA